MAGMDRFQRAIEAIDRANAEDPHGKEPAYSRQMTEWLERLEPNASEALRLAARAQHIRRWMIPRETYPMDRAGYHQWRTRLYHFHAEQAAAILAEAGYDEATIARVQALLRKEGLKTDPEMQTLEDVICLVFLEHYFPEFRQRKTYPDEKWVTILRRTWAKMSQRGRDEALKLTLDDETLRLVKQALQIG